LNQGHSGLAAMMARPSMYQLVRYLLYEMTGTIHKLAGKRQRCVILALPTEMPSEEISRLQRHKSFVPIIFEKWGRRD
jgi:hypothetical protein